ncbi:MAG: hypothetical protein JNL49_11080 [Bacteroidia bacterium]|nr:hypothetical protein [Bacteroidia bacterium]
MRCSIEILKDLFLLQGNIESLEKELLKFGWESDLPLHSISNEDIDFVLKRSINEEISFNTIIN